MLDDANDHLNEIKEPRVGDYVDCQMRLMRDRGEELPRGRILPCAGLHVQVSWRVLRGLCGSTSGGLR
jgi:hypothetical protein